MAPRFELRLSVQHGMELGIVNDAGYELCLVVDKIGGRSIANVVGFDNNLALEITGKENISPEEYLEALANFLGYKVTPPPKFHPDASREELEAIILPYLRDPNQWIQAIKALREYTGWGIYAAKTFVDEYRPGGNRYDSSR